MLKQIVVALTVLASAAVWAGDSKLQVQTLTGSPQGFLVNSTLVTGAKEAILIDAAFTRADAHRIVAAVLDSGKTLTYLYITHGHPDHYFGTEVIKQAFPNVKVVASADTVAAIQKSWEAKVKQWGPMYGANLSDKPVVPEVLAAKSLSLEGEKLELVGPVQGDEGGVSYVWIPSLKTVVAGDVVFHGVHVWTAETKPADRKVWASTLDKIDALKPVSVIAGHQKPELKAEPSSVGFVKSYLSTFEQAVASSKTSDEVQSKVKAKYGDLALDIVLKIGADANVAPTPAERK